MTRKTPTALIADDEPLLRTSLARMLADAWPELEIVAQARNGREALEQFEALKPDICFLDVRMPGLSGVDAARKIGRRARLVFVTAYDQYAVQAFEHEAIDYLVKPVEPERLADTVARLKTRIGGAQPLDIPEALLEELAARLKKDIGPEPLRWIHASIGSVLRVIPVEDVDFLRSDDKYTVIGWRGDAGKPSEALVRTGLKDLVPLLDATHFVQVHRSVVVNRRAISHVTRTDNETAQIHLKGRPDVLPVSRTYLHLFKGM
jgi:DNA-binding LytR/AlgR family response regulator